MSFPGLPPDDSRMLNEWIREMDDSKPQHSAWVPRPPNRGPQRRRTGSSKPPSRPADSLSDLGKLMMEYRPQNIGWRADPDSWARSMARRWAEAMFDIAETRSWLRAGVDVDEVALAEELRSLGLNAASAKVSIRGETMIDRVRSGVMSRPRLEELVHREGLTG